MFFLLDLSLLQFFSIFSILAFFKWGESYSHNMSELNETLEIFSFRDPQSIIRGSTRPLQGVHKVKIIFIIIPRCYLHLHSHQCKVSFPEATQYVITTDGTQTQTREPSCLPLTKHKEDLQHCRRAALIVVFCFGKSSYFSIICFYVNLHWVY